MQSLLNLGGEAGLALLVLGGSVVIGDTSCFTVMSFVCSKHEQTTTRNAQLPQKALLLAKTEIMGEPALMLKLDYVRKKNMLKSFHLGHVHEARVEAFS